MEDNTNKFPLNKKHTLIEHCDGKDPPAPTLVFLYFHITLQLI